MSDNLVQDFIEREGYKDNITDADKKLIKANTKLSDEKIMLKRELEKAYKIIDKAKDYVEEKGRLKYYPNELLKILEGDEYEK